MRLRGVFRPVRSGLSLWRGFQSVSAASDVPAAAAPKAATAPIRGAVFEGHKPLSDMLSKGDHGGVEREWTKMSDRATAADYAVVMSSRMKNGKGGSVLALVDEMRQKKLLLTPGVYKCIMQRYRETGEGFSKFEALWDEMRDNRVSPKANVLNLYLEQMRDMARKGKNNSTAAEELPSRMWRFCSWARKTFDLIGDVKTFELVLSVTSEQSHLSLATDILQHMKDDKVPIALCHAHHFLAVGLARRALPLVTEGYNRVMELNPNSINEGTWMELLLFWAHRGNFVNMLAVEPHLAMRFPQTQPAEAFYRLVIHAMTKVSSADHVSYVIPWVELFRTLHRLEDRGFSLGEGALVHRLLGPLDKVENVDAAFYALEDMRDSKVEPVRLSDLNLVIRGCGRAGDLDRGLATLAEIPKFGLTADVESFAALLKVCVSCRDVQAGVAILAQMEGLGIEPDVRCKKMLAHLLCTHEYIDRCVALVREVGASCPPETAHSAVWMLMNLERNAEADELRKWYQSLNPNFKIADDLAATLDERTYDMESVFEENATESKQ
jgi:pentatricopeptide repeat protein